MVLLFSHGIDGCAGKQVETLQLKIAEMQTTADLGSRQISGLQYRLNALQEDKRQLEACLDTITSSQEVTSNTMHTSVLHSSDLLPPVTLSPLPPFYC